MRFFLSFLPDLVVDFKIVLAYTMYNRTSRTSVPKSICVPGRTFFCKREKTMAMVKCATTYEEQLAILERRGVIIPDRSVCTQILENVNYYRLMAYFLPCKQADDTYKPGTDFLKVYRVYEFDRKLRRVLFSALEEVEISLRSRFAYYHAHKYGPIGYLDASNYSVRHNHEKFMEQIQREIDSNRKVLFVKHHLEQYEGVFPIWVISELFTFGMLSRFYSDLPLEDQKHLSKGTYSTTPNTIRSWLRCCSDLRNICAHYGRLYYRIFSAIPSGVAGDPEKLRRLWGAIHALRGLYLDSEKWNTEVLPAISALIEEYSDVVELYRLAFPPEWERLLRK